VEIVSEYGFASSKSQLEDAGAGLDKSGFWESILQAIAIAACLSIHQESRRLSIWWWMFSFWTAYGLTFQKQISDAEFWPCRLSMPRYTYRTRPVATPWGNFCYDAKLFGWLDRHSTDISKSDRLNRFQPWRSSSKSSSILHTAKKPIHCSEIDSACDLESAVVGERCGYPANLGWPGSSQDCVTVSVPKLKVVTTTKPLHYATRCSQNGAFVLGEMIHPACVRTFWVDRWWRLPSTRATL